MGQGRRVTAERSWLRGVPDEIRGVCEAVWVKTCIYSEESKLPTNTRKKGSWLPCHLRGPISMALLPVAV